MSQWRLLVSLAAVVFFLAGCDGKEEQVAAPKPTPAVQGKRETRVVVPPEVQGNWKAVRITVLDKEKNRQEEFTIELGQEIVLPGSPISIRAQNFLPAFIMDGTTLTSVSNETRNPAVQIIVREQGEEIFKGWLFSLYPGTHAFQHPRYSFTLVDYLPAKKD